MARHFGRGRRVRSDTECSRPPPPSLGTAGDFHFNTSTATSAHAAGRAYNVGEVESLSELEWARLIGSVTGWGGELIALSVDQIPAHLHMPGNLDQHWTTDTTRIRRELGYTEPIARDEAIRRTIEWERAHPPSSDPRAFDYAAEDAALS